MLAKNDATQESLLLCFPTHLPSRLWMGIWADTWHLLGPLLKSSTANWGNTHVTRPYFFQKHGDEATRAWRSVWRDKNVCVIAGKGSRFELIPELFDSAASITRLDAPPRDAFDEVGDIAERALSVDGIDMYLIALGPTGTVLAGLLNAAGGTRQAIDIGHLSSSYANVFLGGKFPESVPLTRRV